MSAFFHTDRVFRNAESFQVNFTKIDKCIVDDFITETGRWYSALSDDEDEGAKQIRLQVWQLRSIVADTLLPFDSLELRLQLQFNYLKSIAVYNPNLHERSTSLAEIIDCMMAYPTNPKRETLFRILDNLDGKGKGIAIVAATGRLVAADWTEQLIRDIRRHSPNSDLIFNKRMLVERTYERIILPSGGRYCPFLVKLYCGYLTDHLHVIAYQRERVTMPEKIPLPTGSIAKTSLTAVDTLHQEPSNQDDTRIDTWVQLEYWNSLRGNAQNQLVTQMEGKDRHYMVKARLVMLGGGAKVFLQDDVRIMEISDFIEGKATRFPRRLISELKAGDMIVLRTSGSGDYVTDVAKSLLKKSGKADLYDTALSWKRMLRFGLETYGAELIEGKLATKGFTFSTHNYIWMWTTDQFIKPKSQGMFSELIAVLEELDCSEDIADPLSMVEMWWRQMREIFRYHIKAGQEIRKALLLKLRNIIEEGVIIADSYSLTLPGVDAGELSVFRIAGIDSMTVDLPYHHTGMIIRPEDIAAGKLWQN